MEGSVRSKKDRMGREKLKSNWHKNTIERKTWKEVISTNTNGYKS